MKLVLDTRFKKKVVGMFGKYSFEVGVDESPHKKAKIGERGKKGMDVVTQYAGGPARKKSRDDSGLSMSQVVQENINRLGKNFLTEPFEEQSSDIIKFSREFFKIVFNMSGSKRRVENLLQAIVRNPILRGEVGSNSEVTQKIKGFNRPLIDTAQMFKAIKAKCTVK